MSKIKKYKNNLSFWSLEKKFLKNKQNILALDEAGRGALAGPLSVGGLFLDKLSLKLLIKNKIFFFDSKILTPEERFLFRKIIKKLNLPHKVVLISNKTIDKKGVVYSFITGIEKIYKYFQPEILIIDGPRIKNFPFPYSHFFIKGDRNICSLGGASILAKTKRDDYMNKIDLKIKGYNFSRNKGYGTKEHLKVIKIYGPSKIHRRSFLNF